MTPAAHAPRLALLAALALLPLAAGATQLCRWVDETGRTQLSDTVPPQYLGTATCIDSRKYELSPEAQREADQRAAQERARVRNEAATQPPEPPPSVPAPAAAASAPVVKRPAQQVTDATDCATWWRLYDESADCFGPYRNVRGGIRPEAFDVCNPVESPVPKCGPRVN